MRLGAAELAMQAGGRCSLELAEAGAAVQLRGRCGLTDSERSRLVLLRQVHGAGLVVDPTGGEEADAMVVRRGGRFPALRVADCLPVLAATRRHLAAAHAGWRGLAAGVAGRLLDALPGPPLAVVLGPAICGSCYRVGEEVSKAMSRFTDPEAHPPGRLDLAAAALDQLEAAGLPADVPVYHMDSCTLCGEAGLFSYRGGDLRARNHIWLEEFP
ncbi:MAG: polyphenol oxidase family protein [Candidatus Fermentibacteraceae bacterium]